MITVTGRSDWIRYLSRRCTRKHTTTKIQIPSRLAPAISLRSGARNTMVQQVEYGHTVMEEWVALIELTSKKLVITFCEPIIIYFMTKPTLIPVQNSKILSINHSVWNLNCFRESKTRLIFISIYWTALLNQTKRSSKGNRYIHKRRWVNFLLMLM